MYNHLDIVLVWLASWLEYSPVSIMRRVMSESYIITRTELKKGMAYINI